MTTTTTFEYRDERPAGLDARTLHWLDYEQTVNERTFRDSTRGPVDLSNHTVKAAYRPERRATWPQEVVWLPLDRVRVYGSFQEELATPFGHHCPAACVPLFVHPQPPAAHRRLQATFGSAALPEVWATPTASYRSVLAWRRGREPVVLKLSLGVKLGRAGRALTEAQVASGVLMSHVLDTIPLARRQEVGFDWFPEPAGVVETLSKSGWLLRRLPEVLTGCYPRSLVPVFSLISPRGERAPLIVDLIRRSGRKPEAFIIEELIRPYVKVLAYLLFEEGIQVEGHAQNVLVEIDADEGLTGRVVLRDLSDMSVSIPLRVAKRKPLPALDRDAWPAAPFPLASVASDHRCAGERPWLMRARDTVERYGLGGFAGAVNASLARYFPGYDGALVEHTYLTLWQREAVRFLHVKPLLRAEPQGLATDEALAHFLQNVDWRSLGCTGEATLPKGAEPLLIERRVRRHAGAVYGRLACAWGELFFEGGLPAFFRPAL